MHDGSMSWSWQKRAITVDGHQQAGPIGGRWLDARITEFQRWACRGVLSMVDAQAALGNGSTHRVPADFRLRRVSLWTLSEFLPESF